MNEAIIMPTRGDRDVLESFTVKRFREQGNTIYRDTSPAYNDKCDIVPRVRQLYEWTKHYDWIWILENDDYYPIDYLDRMRDFRDDHGMEWVGSNRAMYYHLGQQRYQEFKWRWNSGLWNMGFNPEVLRHFLWPPDTETFLDSWICKWVEHTDVPRGMFNYHGAIGIKGHGIGKHGSQGSHTKAMRFKHEDQNYQWLKDNTDQEYFAYLNKTVLSLV